MEGKGIITGIISTRKCPKCGHHEVGVTTADGSFYPLKPGAYVQVFSFEDQKIKLFPMDQVIQKKEERKEEKKEEKKERPSTSSSSEMIPWLPEILRRNKKLRLKYGVMIRADEQDMDEDKYRIAFIRKLQGLIEKETYPELAIILDKTFQSPHLASGNTAEITLNLLRDIEEIRKPIELMSSWLKHKTDSALNNLIAPLSKDELTELPVSDKKLAEELEELTLEEFLELLEN